jgi:hypothetical protein
VFHGWSDGWRIDSSEIIGGFIGSRYPVLGDAAITEEQAQGLSSRLQSVSSSSTTCSTLHLTTTLLPRYVSACRLIGECWSPQAVSRPTFSEIISRHDKVYAHCARHGTWKDSLKIWSVYIRRVKRSVKSRIHTEPIKTWFFFSFQRKMMEN